MNPDRTPRVTFKSITFSDGTQINLDPADVVVFVGPNNAGKSAALRELDDTFNDTRRSLTVLQAYDRRTPGTADDFADFVTEQAYTDGGRNSDTFLGYRWSLGSTRRDRLKEMWPNRLQSVKALFCQTMPTENRLEGSRPPEAVTLGRDQLQHPIHMLLVDDSLETNISDYFRNAFGVDLILDRFPARHTQLLVGNRPVPDQGIDEDRASKTYHDKLHASTTPLVDQGDGMRSFASVILHLLAPTTASVLLLDEPEAFLHPPQARLLGEIIASEKPPQTQLFVATHSPDVLKGFVNVASNRLRLLRIQREGNVNRVKELDKDLVRRISSDPLMNYSSVMAGVFHERVIICESDSDCLFYSSILNLDEVHGGTNPDVLFVHANGKDRMAILARTLTGLGVPVDVIADFDVVRDEGGMKRIVNALGSDWPALQQLARSVRTSVNDSNPRLTPEQIKQAIREILDADLTDREPERELRSKVDGVFRTVSPWDAVKQNGLSAIPQGQPTRDARVLQDFCMKTGLWTVPVGEMEGFCRSIDGHGPRWVQQLIEERDIATDGELEGAREFVRTLWERGH